MCAPRRFEASDNKPVVIGYGVAALAALAVTDKIVNFPVLNLLLPKLIEVVGVVTIALLACRYVKVRAPRAAANAPPGSRESAPPAPRAFAHTPPARTRARPPLRRRAKTQRRTSTACSTRSRRCCRA